MNKGYNMINFETNQQVPITEPSSHNILNHLDQEPCTTKNIIPLHPIRETKPYNQNISSSFNDTYGTAEKNKQSTQSSLPCTSSFKGRQNISPINAESYLFIFFGNSRPNLKGIKRFEQFRLANESLGGSFDVDVIMYMINNDYLVPTIKFVALSLLSKNNDLYNTVYRKFIENWFRSLDLHTCNYKNDKPFYGIYHLDPNIIKNIIDLVEFIGYYGEPNIMKALLDDFQKYPYIIPKEKIITSCMDYAAYSGNIGIIKYILSDDICKSDLIFWTIQPNRAACIAFYSGKRDVYELLCERSINTQVYIMDLCIYEGNLDLLKGIYSKYGTNVSDFGIQYCIENNMMNFIVYFISAMNIEPNNIVLDFCKRNSLNQFVNTESIDLFSSKPTDYYNMRNSLHKRVPQHGGSDKSSKRRNI